mgnify:CR=1 FL=1
MIVDQSHRLHEGIDDRTADEAKAAFLEVRADAVGHFGLRRDVGIDLAAVDDRFIVNKRPNVLVERAKFLLDFLLIQKYI